MRRGGGGGVRGQEGTTWCPFPSPETIEIRPTEREGGRNQGDGGHLMIKHISRRLTYLPAPPKARIRDIISGNRPSGSTAGEGRGGEGREGGFRAGG